MDRLLVKWETARHRIPKSLERKAATHTSVGILAYGSSDGAVHEALDRLSEQGFQLDYLRVRGFPFGDEVIEFLDQHDTVFVVEQNRDAQLRALLLVELADRGCASAEKLVSVLHYNGMPIPSSCVIDAVRERMSEEAAA